VNRVGRRERIGARVRRHSRPGSRQDGGRIAAGGNRSTQVETGHFRADDGTRLACYEAGDPHGVPLVLCGGLGGSFAIWRPVVEHFGGCFRVLAWDYRGLYASAPPRRRRVLALTHHVHDLLALLRHKRAEAPVLVGWSMGVQVALELHREHPGLPRALVGLFGTAGRPFETAFDAGLAPDIAPRVLGALRAVGTRLRGVGPWLARAPGIADAFVRAGRGLGMMAPSLDVERFRDIAEDWTRLDLAIYADHFEALARHDASDLLAQIRTPTLLIAGGRDRLTPAHLAERMAKAMPDAVFELLPEATHFGLLEEPAAIVARIARFSEERLGIRVRAPGRP
jgi:pimeloyl-ACP methyl ester carboxylesterase